MILFLLGAICGVIVMGAVALVLVRRELARPWWRA